MLHGGPAEGGWQEAALSAPRGKRRLVDTGTWWQSGVTVESGDHSFNRVPPTLFLFCLFLGNFESQDNNKIINTDQISHNMKSYQPKNAKDSIIVQNVLAKIQLIRTLQKSLFSIDLSNLDNI